LKRIPDLGEDAVKRTWRGVRQTTVFSSGQKRKLIKTLKNRKHIHKLRKRLDTIKRQLSNAGNKRSSRKTRRSQRKPVGHLERPVGHREKPTNKLNNNVFNNMYIIIKN